MKKYAFFITIFLVLFGFTSKVSADTISIDMPMTRPQITESSGYIIVLLERVSDGYLNGMLYQFDTMTTPIDANKVSGEPWVTIGLTDNTITGSFFAGANNSGFTTSFRRTSTGSTQLNSWAYSVTGDNNPYTLWSGGTSWNIVGYYIEGYVAIASGSSLTKTYNFNVNWGTETTEYELLQACLDYLVAIYGDQVDLYNLTVDIFNNTSDIKEVLNNLFSYIEEYYPKIYQELLNIYIKLDDLNSNLISTHDLLLDLYKLLLKQYSEYQGEESTDKVDTETITDYNDTESTVIDKNKDPNDISADINISLNSNSNAYVWNLVTEILNTNTKIFTFIISMLSLGAIALVLGRG